MSKLIAFSTRAAAKISSASFYSLEIGGPQDSQSGVCEGLWLMIDNNAF